MKLLLIFLSYVSLQAFGQVLDNRNGEAFTDKPFFNTSFIKENKLKKLKGTFTYKKQGQMMRATEFMYVYEFDTNGLLISTFETRTDDGTKDTTWNLYSYDDQHRLIKYSKTDMEGFVTTHYKYDSLNRLISEEFIRDIDSNGVVVRSLSFNKESFNYHVFENQTKRTRYNNYNLPYLDEYFNYNDEGYLLERIERVKMTSMVYTYHYEYNEKGKLAAIRKSSNRAEGYIEELKFQYDELGNLLEKHVYKNGIFTTDYQMIYNSKSKLLSTVITRQVSTNFLLILRFQDYEFFD
jgi:YD repeat-containing protein